MRRLALAAVLLAGTALASPASAASVFIESIVGNWTDVDPNVASGVGTPQIKWGTSTGSGQSSYTFTASANPPPPDVQLNNGDGFNLGTFTHDNNPITGNSITHAVLDVYITFHSDFFGGSQVAHSKFEFDHNETPNDDFPNCAGGTGHNGIGVNINGCADIVKATLNTTLSSVYVVGDHTYTFGITDFQVGNTHFAQFVSPEEQSNSAILRASFNDVQTFAVPGPAVGAGIPGLVAACGALFGFNWRRRRRLLGS